MPVNIIDKILLKPVDEYIYLGHHLKHNLDDSDDIKSKLNKFYASFHSLYRKFNNLNIDAILYLFNSYCSPVYGLQLWCCRNIFRMSIFKAFHIAYSNSLKRIVGCPKFYSSHFIANVCNLFLFNHKVSILQLKYFNRILESRNKLFMFNKFLFKFGYYGTHLFDHFKNFYSIDILRYDNDILLSRIS